MENFHLLPVGNIISVLKKMDARTFSRAYRTCQDMKEIADKARAEIKLELKDNEGKGFGLDFNVNPYVKDVIVQIYKPVFSQYEFIVARDPLYRVSAGGEEALSDILKQLSFFKWKVINHFPGGIYCYANEDATPRPALIYVDWIFRALNESSIVCEKLQSPPNLHITEALNRLKVKIWHTREPTGYERKKLDWISTILETEVVEKNITFSVKLGDLGLSAKYVDDFPRILKLFNFLDIAVLDSCYMGRIPLNTSLSEIEQRVNHLRMFPKSQDVKFSIWSQFGYPNIEAQQFLNFPFTEYTGFVDAAEIHRRQLQLDPKILHVPTVDSNQHIMMIIFQGRSHRSKFIHACYLKIYYVTVNDWESSLKELTAVFQPIDEGVPVDISVDQINKEFFEF